MSVYLGSDLVGIVIEKTASMDGWQQLNFENVGIGYYTASIDSDTTTNLLFTTESEPVAFISSTKNTVLFYASSTVYEIYVECGDDSVFNRCFYMPASGSNLQGYSIAANRSYQPNSSIFGLVKFNFQ